MGTFRYGVISDQGIDPVTPFEELPEDFECPVCGLGKDAFEREEYLNYWQKRTVFGLSSFFTPCGSFMEAWAFRLIGMGQKWKPL